METEKFKVVENLEIGKDYIADDGAVLVIDRKGDSDNIGFWGDEFGRSLTCIDPYLWREATPEEVKERFEEHLVKRYGEDWKTIKIKEKHPDSHPAGSINNNSYVVDFSKTYGDWRIWNKNGLLYCHGVWVERLEEEEINIRPSETQIGGSHYSDMAIQPIEFIHKNGLSFIQGNVIKYVCRYKSKGGIEDLNKAKHYIDLLIEFEEE